MRLLDVAFKTLGCKLNQLESESVAEAFSAVGARIRPYDEKADLYVVNTCTVTGKAEQKARRVIRQALAINPEALVLVTGCYAQVSPDELALLHPRVVVLPGEEKAALLSLSSWLQDNWQGQSDLLDLVAEWKAGLAGKADPFAYHPKTFAFHSRPSLKIQDGCDNRCAYCRVCLARGPARSLAAESALERVRALEQGGKAEVVLTGVNLAQYRDGAMRFPDLLAFLIGGTERIRFRISSYEPERVDADFLSVFADPRVQPHLHLAAQSGSNAVLRRMARPYGAERIGEAAAGLRKARRDPFVAADIIVGFPGESEAEFEETYGLCAALDFAWIHAFPFSARPGTRAFDMKPKIPERLAGERAARLGVLALVGKARYVERWTGETVGVIIENRVENSISENDAEPARIETPSPTLSAQNPRMGTSENYLKICVENVPISLSAGALAQARITGPDRGGEADAAAVFEPDLPKKC